jgi:CxxC motif-containing protein (DUF1111 family)
LNKQATHTTFEKLLYVKNCKMSLRKNYRQDFKLSFMKKSKELTLIAINLLLMIISCSPENDNEILEGENAGGATTVFTSGSKAFAQPAPNLTAKNLTRHNNGDADFEATFVSDPSPVNGGLGSIFNNNSCVACHTTDGRAVFPYDINALSGIFLKISLPGKGEHNAPIPVPDFGTQLQHQSVYGYEKEARLSVQFRDSLVYLADGTAITLRRSIFSIIEPYTTLPPDVLISPRIGMPVFGLGLLEAIPESSILANADENDINKDSISGKPNYVWDPVNNKISLGRFGWKAGTASILLQVAGAYNEDMGLTNPVKPVESSYGQTNSHPSSISPEVSQETLDNVTFYCQTLGVPAVRNISDPQVVEGRKIFDRINCNSCHVPSFTTGSNPLLTEVSNQRIYPYTDMLLHDMGEGLADNREEFEANGREWKTRPLWGIGLTEITSGHTNLLHDGRARNINEAIMWHGGEANPSKEGFRKLSKADREALLKFINSL